MIHVYMYICVCVYHWLFYKGMVLLIFNWLSPKQNPLHTRHKTSPLVLAIAGCIHVYMYIYTYMYIYIYTCIYVYIYGVSSVQFS